MSPSPISHGHIDIGYDWVRGWGMGVRCQKELVSELSTFVINSLRFFKILLRISNNQRGNVAKTKSEKVQNAEIRVAKNLRCQNGKFYRKSFNYPSPQIVERLYISNMGGLKCTLSPKIKIQKN